MTPAKALESATPSGWRADRTAENALNEALSAGI